MPSFHPGLLSPTLAVLAMLGGVGPSGFAATADERDEHFKAITAVIAHDLPINGQRLAADFAKSGYPDDQWHRRFNEWFILAKQRSLATDPAKAAEFDKAASALRTQLDAAEDAGKLPEEVSRVLASAGSQSAQLIKDLTNFINPDEADPTVPRSADRAAIANRQVVALIESTRKEWNRALAKVKANAAAEKGMLERDEKDPQTQELLKKATMLRSDAVRAVYYPYTVLRDVVSRGQAFGLDAKPVTSFFSAFFNEPALTVKGKPVSVGTAIADWEYSFGDYYPDLKVYAGVVLGEAFRQKVPELKIEEIEASLQGVSAIDVQQYRDKGSRDHVQQLQIITVTSLMRSRLEAALAAKGDQAKVLAKQGLDFFTNYREAIRGQKEMTALAEVPTRAWFCGQLWITAARLNVLAGETSAANALLGEVVSNRRTLASDLARSWIARISGAGAGGATGDDWGRPTQAGEAAQVLAVAQALIKETKGTSDPAAQRTQMMATAVQLRSGLLGLADAPAQTFIDTAPEMYGLYVQTLSKLELRHQTVLAAAEGLRQIASRVTKTSHPWKNAAGAWTDSGRHVQVLVKNSMTYASQLASRSKGAGVGNLQSEIIELVKRISPEDAGQGADETLVYNALSDGDWQRAITQARTFLAKYPTQQPRAYSWIVSAYQGWFDESRKAKDEARLSSIARDLQAATQTMESEARNELAKKPAAERERDWMRVLSTVQAAKLTVLIAGEKWSEVLTSFGPEFWKNPPADESLRARVLRGLCNAAIEVEKQRGKDPKAAEAGSIKAAAESYFTAYETFKRFQPSIKDPQDADLLRRSGRNLGAAINLLTRPAETAGLAPVAADCRRAVADLWEPTLSDKDKPDLVRFVADTLWSINEHERALRLYGLYMTTTGNDGELSEFLSAPKNVLDRVENAVGSRQEVAAKWKEVRDLLEDQPELADLRRKGAPVSDYKEKPINYGAALAGLATFREKVTELKPRLGDGWTKADESLKALERLTNAAASRISIKSRMALGARETGNGAKARELYGELYAYDQTNPTYAAAYVELVLDQVKAGTLDGKSADVSKAADVARTVRNQAGNDLDLFWQASIQVFELSMAQGDSKTVREKLQFNAVNRSGPTYDLILPPVVGDDRQSGDDKRVRRARNALAVELSKRYDALLTADSIGLKPSSRIDTISTADGKTWTLFVPVEAPEFVAQTVTNRDDTEITVFVEKGASAIKSAASEGKKP